MIYKTMLKWHIKKPAITVTLFCTGVLIALAFQPEASKAEETNLTVNGEYLSANLKETSLHSIFEALEREKGIWLKGNLSLLDEKITVQFTDQSLEDGIKRILAPINYCLVFESDGALSGAILIEKGKDGPPSSVKYTADANKNTIPQQADSKMERSGINSEVETEMGSSPVSRSSIGSKQYLKDLEILTNFKPQAGPAKMTPERQLECLKILRDGPSQGTPAKMTPEQMKDLEVLKAQSSQSPPI